MVVIGEDTFHFWADGSERSAQDCRPLKKHCRDSVDNATTPHLWEGVVTAAGNSYNSMMSSTMATSVRSNWFDHVQFVCPGGMIATNDDALERKHALDSLTMQLRQVKRRLGPATAQCALAMRTSDRIEFDEARRACNPFEPLGEGRQHGGLNRIFMNRSAMKLANLDAMLDFSLTTTTAAAVGRSTTTHQPFLFADLCCAPGGFSEYLMRRCFANGIPCRGYGMSLLGTNEHGRGTDWKLRDVREEWCNYRVSAGADGTGDIYNWENVESFGREITSDLHLAGLLSSQQQLTGREGGKLDLVVADGGFDAQRDSECQEELAQKIVVCQAAAALQLLSRGGTLVIKMFGFRTAVVRAVMHDLFNAFDKTVAMKPISSRPASAERYVICSGFHGVPTGWNGVEWRSRMFLADWTQATAAASTTDSPLLCQYLDGFDRQMLSLNLTTCFDILTYLERKAQNQYYYGSTSLPPDLLAYKQSWRLDELEQQM